MKVPRAEMNIKMSQICNNYDLDYWVWTPADVDLSNQAKFSAEVRKHAAFYKSCPRLDGVFFPGGDPGNNHPKYVMPFLKEVAAELHKYHPKAGVWISLQGFDDEMVDYFYQYLKENNPDWLTGVVSGRAVRTWHKHAFAYRQNTNYGIILTSRTMFVANIQWKTGTRLMH